jgi:two-component system alkaline phosphatase synthesis response regulator PhoP
MKNKILLVEDDDIVAEAVTYNLMWNGFQVNTVVDGASALKHVKEELPDLVILDIALPLMNGLEVCRELRKASNTATLPIIMLTARGREIDKEAGLDAGADDYMTKPFERRELLARVRAVLRRAQYAPVSPDGRAMPEEQEAVIEPAPTPKAAPLVADPLKIDLAGRRITCRGKELELTYRQFELITYLVRNRGIVLTRDQLLHHVWGRAYDGEPRTLDVHIHWLRESIEEDPRNPCFIETVRGIGYRFR